MNESDDTNLFIQYEGALFAKEKTRRVDEAASVALEEGLRAMECLAQLHRLHTVLPPNKATAQDSHIAIEPITRQTILTAWVRQLAPGEEVPHTAAATQLLSGLTSSLLSQEYACTARLGERVGQLHRCANTIRRVTGRVRDGQEGLQAVFIRSEEETKTTMDGMAFLAQLLSHNDTETNWGRYEAHLRQYLLNRRGHQTQTDVWNDRVRQQQQKVIHCVHSSIESLKSE
ncbi:hypothetical protein AGDE_13519 [Angomonas deanei]|uniref:Uncharacterized protein n=1 Tax=Angomonas deanei TaxID=59799 RepID=A0A7G2C035_9TRYP|nr:hypothetical protein AGDE_13519 [Angomonas deanei]CAD2213148.1 hypothetical protein, conserved [Angomonas deanei]|eukprot:EPY22249.1 hypothetical protein AGDE_13519 [Angomonas deanei]